MKDTIYRQDAIDTFLTTGSFFVYGENVCKAVASRLKELPSVEPNWNEMLVICDNCGHAIHVKRIEVEDE